MQVSGHPDPSQPVLGDINTTDQMSISLLKRRLKEVDERIQTWINICHKEKIDISAEEKALGQWEDSDRRTSAEEGELSHKVVHIATLVEKGEQICQQIVKKVQSNIKRDSSENQLFLVWTNLSLLTKCYTMPWVETAIKEGVSIKEELNSMLVTNQDSLQQLSETTINPTHSKEIVQRRLLKTRTMATAQIILKTFIHRVRTLADTKKSTDWFDDKRIWIIDGIVSDALTSLSIKETIPKIIEHCQKIFSQLEINLQLYENMPELYTILADREWLKRSLIIGANQLIELAIETQNEKMVQEITKSKKIALDLLATTLSNDEILSRANEVFAIYTTKLNANISFSCAAAVRQNE